ncbi:MULTISPECIES: DUF6893 family small protein [unclassified Streptomyces]
MRKCVIGAAIAVAAVAALARQFVPDVQRYLRMRRM